MDEGVLLTECESIELAAACADQDLQEVLRCVFARFPSRLALCTSFQASGIVILDMAWRLYP